MAKELSERPLPNLPSQLSRIVEVEEDFLDYFHNYDQTVKEARKRRGGEVCCIRRNSG